MNSMPKLAASSTGFSFTVADGKVTAMQFVNGSQTHNLPLPGAATFSVGANSVTETLVGKSGTESVVYTADSTNKSLYHITSDTHTVTTPTTSFGVDHVLGYDFTVSGGAVTDVKQVFGSVGNTHNFTLRASPATSFGVGASSITEVTVDGNVVETIKFVLAGTGGLYAVQSDTHAVIQVGNVLETVTNCSHSTYEVFHDGNADGIYTAVAHGNGVTVDLVGLQAQLATIEALL
jgi:hypothetical protein